MTSTTSRYSPLAKPFDSNAKTPTERRGRDAQFETLGKFFNFLWMLATHTTWSC